VNFYPFAISLLAVVGLKAFAQDPAMPPPPPPAAAQVEAAPADPAVGAGIFAGFLDPFDYDPRGRRDPFAQPVADVPMAPGLTHGPLLPLQAFEVAQLRVVGILWNVRSPKAMVKDPDGKLHIVETNTKVGPRNGYIAVIREGELVVVETIEQEGRLVSTAQVVKIAK
jgi:type IV pilus assembly protein PilP